MRRTWGQTEGREFRCLPEQHLGQAFLHKGLHDFSAPSNPLGGGSWPVKALRGGREITLEQK